MMNPRSVLQWSLRLLPLALLLMMGCAEHHGPITVRVENQFTTPIEVYRTGLNHAGTREMVLIGKVGPSSSADFPGALPPGEKIYHLKFKRGGKFVGESVATDGDLKKIANGTWSVTAAP